MTNIPNNILFEKFEIIEVLKKDDTAAVYLANHIFLSKKIILKTLNTKIVNNKVAADRFKREAQILAKLDHPNIIKVYDFGTHGDFFYISFEYFGNRNLRHLIKENNLSQLDKKKLLVQLYKGLNFAHANNIIHRDIKPENIFLNENIELKLGDFGLAKALDENIETGKYSIVGTPCYMSPEQIEGGNLTEQSDIFSAGVLVYEIYTGENIFLGENVNETINNVINYSFESIENSLNEFPEEIRLVIEKSLQREAVKRFDSVNEILKIIDTEFTEISNTKKISSSKNIAAIASAVIIIIALIILLYPQKNGNADFEKNNNLVSEEAQKVTKPKTAFEEKDNVTKLPIEEPGINELNDEVIEEPVEKTISENNNKIEEQPVETNQTTYGNLNIKCVPWADVIIDDKIIDTTPIADKIRLKVGEYNLRLVHPDYPEVIKSISINENETTELFVNLNKSFGWLNFRVHPWGEIFINEKLVGQTPMDAPAPVTPGTLNLEIKNPNYKSELKEINVIGGDTILITHNFAKSRN